MCQQLPQACPEQAGQRRLTAQDVERLRQRDELVFVLEQRVFILPPSFLHPGGDKVLRAFAGRDIGSVFGGQSGHHRHSDAAHRLLQRYQVGVLISDDAAQPDQGPSPSGQPRIDPSQPMALLVGHLGAEYARWVHEPELGAPRFFSSDLAELLTKTPWWVVPLAWAPLACLALWRARAGVGGGALAALLLAGLCLWHVTEYCVHRFLFHREPRGYWGVTLHFLLHGCHHKYPTDRLRLVFPPIPMSLIVAAMFGLLGRSLPEAPALALFGGWLAGYVLYDCFHYATHYGARFSGYLGRMRSKHMDHHYRDPNVGFGISSNVLDVWFGTLGQLAHQ